MKAEEAKKLASSEEPFSKIYRRIKKFAKRGELCCYFDYLSIAEVLHLRSNGYIVYDDYLVSWD